MNSSVNMSNKKSQFFEINPLFVLAYHLIGHGPSAAKKLTSALNMTQPISKTAWKRQTEALTDAAVNVSNNSMKKAALEVKETSSQQHFIHTQGWFVRRSHRSKQRCWWLLGLQRISSCQGIKDICSEETGKVIDIILKNKTCSIIKAQKDAGSIII